MWIAICSPFAIVALAVGAWILSKVKFFPPAIFVALLFFTLGGILIWAMIKGQKLRNNEKAEVRKKQEAYDRMSPEEKQTYKQQLRAQFFSTLIPKDEQKCPGCGDAMYYYDAEKGRFVDKWKLVSSHETTTEKLDSAYRLGGSTTAFYKTEKKVVKGYQCPKCGFTRYK